MKAISIFLLAVLFSAGANSQTVKFQWGEEVSKVGDYYAEQLEFLMEQDGNFYFIAAEKRNFSTTTHSVYKFGSDLKLISTTEIDFPEKINSAPAFMGGKGELVDAVYFGGKGYLLFSSHDNKADRSVVTLTEVVDNGSKITFKHKPIANASASSQGDSYIKTSSDGSKLVIVHGVASGENDVYTLDVAVFDTNLNELWRETTKPENYYYNRFIKQYPDVSIDDQGVVVFSYRERNPEYTKSYSSSNKIRKYFKTNILLFTNNGTNVKTYYPEAGNYTIGYLTVVTYKGKLFCAGNVFDPNGEIDSDHGVISFTIGGSGKQTNTVITPLSDFPGISKSKAADDYVFNDTEIFANENGLIVIYESAEANSNSNGQSYYTYKGAIVQQFGSDMQLKWSDYVNKYQKTFSDHGRLSSFFGVVRDDLKTVLVYTAYGQNKDADKEDRDDNATTYQITYDGSGKKSKKLLFDAKASNAYISPSTFSYIGDQKYIILSEEKKKLRLAIVTVD